MARKIWAKDRRGSLVEGRTVKSLQIEQDRPEEHDHDEQPRVVAERDR